ncbi:MAG TPA: hypothetical protein VKU19_18825 [Bryobacteraceae bacterium]|nr:hypothetical protein [Bryobacteraceae bacterium]
MSTQNPLIRLLILVAGAYGALRVLQGAPLLAEIITIAAGLFAAIIWMANYHRAQLYSLSQNQTMGSVINAVCKMAKEQPPVDPSLDTAGQAPASSPSAPPPPGAKPETPKLLLHSDSDFSSATAEIKDVVCGHDRVIDILMDQIKTNVQLRDRASQISMPPLGVFVLAGKPGLGKKYLAIEIGYRLYKGSSVSILDVSDPAAGGRLLVEEARSNPFTTFILENFQSCPPATQEELLSIVAGAPQVDAKTGAKVSFRHCFFFLMVHRDAQGMAMPERIGAGATGHTVVLDSLGEAMHIDKRLGWSIHGIYPFVLPPPLEQAAVVAEIMHQECRKYNLTLGRVDPAILAREVQVISQNGGFEITPSRVAKIMSARLAAAVAAKEQLVDLEDDGAGRVKAEAGLPRGYVER